MYDLASLQGLDAFSSMSPLPCQVLSTKMQRLMRPVGETRPEEVDASHTAMPPVAPPLKRPCDMETFGLRGQPEILEGRLLRGRMLNLLSGLLLVCYIDAAPGYFHREVGKDDTAPGSGH